MFNHIQHNFPQLLTENTDRGRLYLSPNGDKYPSVTTILADYGKEGIMEWRKKVGEEKANLISRQATTRGTAVHKLIERHLKNEDLSNEEMMPNAKALFVRMKEELKKLNNIHCLEDQLISHELRLAGTVDCIAEHNGVLSVIDFKTSRRMKKKADIENYFMQGTAYSIMFEEMTGLKIDQVVIIIGVDEVNFCQTMKVNPADYKDKLQTYIDAYWSK